MNAQLTQVKFNCPSCNALIQTDAYAADDGVKCPQCDVGFVPEKVQWIAAPQPPSLPPPRHLENAADILQACGIISIIIAAIVAFAAAVESSWYRAGVALCWFSAAIFMLILSQLMFIRLALERRDR